MVIVGLSQGSAGEGDGADGRKMPPFGPGGIYHEKQIGSLCALHALNNMLQGPIFDEWTMREVAQELDRQEQRLMGGSDLDYGNARMDGFFNVQVIQTVLNRAGYEMLPVKVQDLKEDKKGEQTVNEHAFILNKREHWFVLRRIGREWFDLNSCLKTPRHYSDRDLIYHIWDAAKEGYSVFNVKGHFPRCALEEDPKKLVEAVQGCGRPDQGYSLFAGSGQRLDSSGQGATHADALRAARLARFGGGGSAAPAPQPSAPAAAPVASPQAAPSPPVKSETEQKIETLMAMGFPREKVTGCLQAAGGSTEMAAEMLLTA